MFAFLAALHSATPAPGSPPATSPVPAATPDLIRDVAPPVDYFPYPMWTVAVAGVLAAALLGVIVFYLVKWARQKPVVIPPRPRSVALDELARLRPQAATLEPYAFSIAVSEVLRRYVEKQYRVPALEQTSPEFLSAIAQDPAFSSAERKLLEGFLESCDAIKFARLGGDASINERLLERAFAFVEGSGS